LVFTERSADDEQLKVIDGDGGCFIDENLSRASVNESCALGESKRNQPVRKHTRAFLYLNRADMPRPIDRA
jgi:hypothetical protein